MSKKDKETADTLPPAAAPAEAVRPTFSEAFVVDDSPEGVERLRAAGFTVTRDLAPGVILCTDAAQPFRLFNGDTVQRMAGGVHVITRVGGPNA
jgi:beta-phosphoglucomutase-like phosphatase (HAD superfamily)